MYQDTNDIQRDVSVWMAKLNLSSTAPPDLSQVMPMAVNLKKFFTKGVSLASFDGWRN